MLIGIESDYRKRGFNCQNRGRVFIYAKYFVYVKDRLFSNIATQREYIKTSCICFFHGSMGDVMFPKRKHILRQHYWCVGEVSFFLRKR